MLDTAANYTDEQLMDHIEDIEAIRQLMHRRVMLMSGEDRRREMDTLWVSLPENRHTACFGANPGYYLGYDSIYRHYVVSRESHRRELTSAMECGGIDTKGQLHFGCCSLRPVNTGMIVISGDGRTAKGLWYSMGQETEALPGGGARYLRYMDKIGVDFIREPGGWKIWHLVTANDTAVEVGEPDVPTYGHGPDYATEEFGTPDLEMTVHNRHFNWWDNFPYPPEPYHTFTDSVSYGPEGHPFRNGMRWDMR